MKFTGPPKDDLSYGQYVKVPFPFQGFQGQGSTAIPSILTEVIPGLKGKPKAFSCPGGRCLVKQDLLNMIIHLNDAHKWSRSKVADWLESLDVDLSFDTSMIGSDI